MGLMLLPQSKAFDSLHVRLESIAGYGMLHGGLPSSKFARPQVPANPESTLPMKELLDEFEKVQKACQMKRLKDQQEKSFLQSIKPDKNEKKGKAKQILGIDEQRAAPKQKKPPK